MLAAHDYIPMNLSFFGGGSGGGGNGFPNTGGGRPNSTIHQGRQDKHIEGTNNHNQQVANGRNPSVLTENPQQLLREGAGRGQQVGVNRERVDFGRVIGRYFHPPTGRYFETTRGIIHYDGRGNAHIVPSRPINFPH